jgi:hypothetical protein
MLHRERECSTCHKTLVDLSYQVWKILQIVESERAEGNVERVWWQLEAIEISPKISNAFICREFSCFCEHVR